MSVVRNGPGILVRAGRKKVEYFLEGLIGSSGKYGFFDAMRGIGPFC